MSPSVFGILARPRGGGTTQVSATPNLPARRFVRVGGSKAKQATEQAAPKSLQQSVHDMLDQIALPMTIDADTLRVSFENGMGQQYFDAVSKSSGMYLAAIHAVTRYMDRESERALGLSRPTSPRSSFTRSRESLLEGFQALGDRRRSYAASKSSVSVSSGISLAESIPHSELDAMSEDSRPGYCYSILVRSELREAVTKELGPSPTLEDLVSRPVEDFVSVAALNSIRAVADEETRLLHVTTNRKNMVRFMTIVRSMDASRAPSGSLWKFASAYSPCTAVFVRDGVWRVGAVASGEYDVTKWAMGQRGPRGVDATLLEYHRGGVRSTKPLKVFLPLHALFTLSRGGVGPASVEAACSYSARWLAMEGFSIPLQLDVVGGEVVKAILGDMRP